MSTQSPGNRFAGTRRRVWLGAAVAVVVVVLTVVSLLLSGGDDDRTPSAAAGETTASTTTAPPVVAAPTAPTPAPTPETTPETTPEPTGPTGIVDDPPPSRSAVALDAAAQVGDGVSASLVSLDAIEGTATGPGNIAGPALRITVRIENGTDEPVSLGGVVVDLASGRDLVPASPLDDPSAAPFAGTVAPGEHADGVYVFTIPEEDRGSVTVSVGYQAGAPLMVFTGSAS
jgi:hypothetical protein